MGLASSAYRKVAPARVEQRRVERQDGHGKRLSVRSHGRQPVEAELMELSIYGCRLTVDAAFKVHDRLWLRFEGSNPVGAVTVWTEFGELGCRFDEPLDRQLFRNLTLMAG